MDNIEALINKINLNDEFINQKSSQLLNQKIKSVMKTIDIALKYLTFQNIDNITNFNFKKYHNGNFIFFNNLCQHAIKVGEYKSGSKPLNCYMNDNHGLYELWLLWNKEFCVSRLITSFSDVENATTYTREIIDYGKCAFALYDDEFIWDMDLIVKTIEDNLAQTLQAKENLCESLNKKLV